MSLTGGNVLITGATGGIGHAIARAFAARGATLTVTGRKLELLEPLAEEVRGRAVACDLSDRADLERLITAGGDTDVLVANAALPASGELTDLSQEQIDRMLEVNLRAPMALARALVPGMIERRCGHLVFVSSLSGKAASRSSSVYSATKFGLRGFALGVREDLRGRGVGASVVLPGFVRDAGMFADADVKLPRMVGTRSPEEVAVAVIRAIERNRAEVEVAPVGLRLGATVASIAPEIASSASRMLGGERIAGDLATGQADKRT